MGYACCVLTFLFMAGCRGSEGASSPHAEPWRAATDVERFECIAPCMGMQARIVLFAEDRPKAKAAGDAAIAEMQRIDRLLSDYREDSETAAVNRAAGGEPVTVSADFLRVLRRALYVSRLSGGAFDVTIGPVTRLWRAARDSGKRPSPSEIDAAHALVNWRDVRFDPKRSTVQLLRADMRLDFGGIGKGFACDLALAKLKEHGITRALVSIAGDIRIGTAPPQATGWRIAIHDGIAENESVLTLSECAVSTSGDAEQALILDGQRHSHIIAPREGLGSGERIGATVIASDATTADALATAITLMPEKDALALIESIDGAAARIARGEPEHIAITSRFPAPASD